MLESELQLVKLEKVGPDEQLHDSENEPDVSLSQS
jgi:hypothetical protein